MDRVPRNCSTPKPPPSHKCLLLPIYVINSYHLLGSSSEPNTVLGLTYAISNSHSPVRDFYRGNEGWQKSYLPKLWQLAKGRVGVTVRFYTAPTLCFFLALRVWSKFKMLRFLHCGPLCPDITHPHDTIISPFYTSEIVLCTTGKPVD